MTSWLRLPLAVGFLWAGVADPQAWAAGIAVREQSSAALGNAFAGATAGAEDITYMFFNPAGLTRHSGHQAAAVVSYILPRADFDPASASTVLGSAISDSAGGEGGKEAAVPAVYGFWDLSPELKAGLGINAPFGLATEYEDGWVGRYHALESSFSSININPVLAYKLGNYISFGAGFQAQYADVKLTHAVDFGTADQVLLAGAAGGSPGGNDGFSRIDGKGWAFGFNAGLLVELSEETRLGLAYRSALTHDLRGDATFGLGGSVGTAFSALTGTFIPTGTKARMDLPETASFGIYHEVNDWWSIMGEAAWTNWSRVKQMRIRFDNPAQSDSLLVLDWRDSWFLALGARIRIDDRVAIRLGAAYDQSPVGNDTRTPRVPDDDRYWLSFGLHYEPWSNLSLDLGYTHLFLADAALRLSATDPGNGFRGNLAGDYESAIDIVTLQARYRF